MFYQKKTEQFLSNNTNNEMKNQYMENPKL